MHQDTSFEEDAMKLFAFLVVAGTVAPIQAEAQMVDAARPQSVVSAMQQAGYRATLETSKSGKPVIRSAANGSEFTVMFDDCNAQNGACKSLAFVAWYKAKPGWTLQRMNQWNDEKKFLRAYIDKDGDVATDYWMTTVGGLTDANFKDALDWFVVISGQLFQFLDGRS
jgi:hypothetical protein